MFYYFNILIIAFSSLLFCLGDKVNGEVVNKEHEIDMEKRMFSYADLMNNFGGPSALELVKPGNNLLLDDERPKREENYNNEDVHIMTLWKRSPSSYLTGDLTKKDEFIAPGVLRFGKRMPGVRYFFQLLILIRKI
uniref:FMRFamide-like peptide 18 n=1 Tax=Meloidogyne graminicola TaxID=189291 RepID=A0A7D4ZEX2_9BILA|nr:FMRFamide-like peptide 18 [Meloidogyne graminicola]